MEIWINPKKNFVFKVNNSIMGLALFRPSGGQASGASPPADVRTHSEGDRRVRTRLGHGYNYSLFTICFSLTNL